MLLSFRHWHVFFPAFRLSSHRLSQLLLWFMIKLRCTTVVSLFLSVGIQRAADTEKTTFLSRINMVFILQPLIIQLQTTYVNIKFARILSTVLTMIDRDLLSLRRLRNSKAYFELRKKFDIDSNAKVQNSLSQNWLKTVSFAPITALIGQNALKPSWTWSYFLQATQKSI